MYSTGQKSSQSHYPFGMPSNCLHYQEKFSKRQKMWCYQTHFQLNLFKLKTENTYCQNLASSDCSYSSLVASVLHQIYLLKRLLYFIGSFFDYFLKLVLQLLLHQISKWTTIIPFHCGLDGCHFTNHRFHFHPLLWYYSQWIRPYHLALHSQLCLTNLLRRTTSPVLCCPGLLVL